MKKNFTPFLLFLFILINRMNFPQFELRYPDIPADYINYLTFIDNNHGFFVNEGGDVIQTSDGGINWKIKKHLLDHNIKEVKFIDSQTGFAYVDKNVIYQDDIPLLYTTNGGESWNETFIALWDALTFHPLSESELVKSSYTGIKKLDNFFHSWRDTYSIPVFIVDSILHWEEFYGQIFQFEELNDNNLLALGNSWRAKEFSIISDSVSYLLNSSDKGNNWDTLWCDLSYEMVTLSFADEFTGWMAGEQERIYKTTDGGLNWFLQTADSLTPFYNMIRTIYAVDDQNIFASGNSKIIFSNDGGNTWTHISVPLGSGFKIFFKDNLNGYAYGEDFFQTSDGGYTWNQVSKSLRDNIIKVDFVNKLTGWALGVGKIYKTIDGGFNWTQQFSFEPVVNAIMGLGFIDSLNGWLAGRYKVYQTSNGGEIWDSLDLGENILFHNGIVEFFNNNLGIISTAYEETNPGSHIYDVPGVFITDDSGISWQKIVYPKTAEYIDFTKLKFISADYLLGINNKGIWLSNDTAKTWQPVYQVQYFLGSQAFDFYNISDGCFSQSGYSLHFTLNAGQDWDILSLSKYIRPNDFQIVGKDISGNYRIFGAGDNGRLFKYTLNGFVDEQYPAVYTSNHLKSIDLFMEDRLPHIWVAGYGFTILYGTTELVVTDIKEDINLEEINYSLFQNYPNPFNPTTKIKYSIPNVETHRDASLQVVLKIYDVLGREVAILVNEEKQPGGYEAEFDASNLSSGIYYYQLKAGNFIETKKMIYLK